MHSLFPLGSKFPPTEGHYMSGCLNSVSSLFLQFWLLQNCLRLLLRLLLLCLSGSLHLVSSQLVQLWLLHNFLKLLLSFFWGYMLRGNLLSLPITKSLTLTFLLKALHAYCTSRAYRFLTHTPIYFTCPVVMCLRKTFPLLKITP